MDKMKQLMAIGLSTCLLFGTGNVSYAMEPATGGASGSEVTITSITPVNGTVVKDEMFFWNGPDDVKFQINFSNGEGCEIDEWGMSSDDEEDYEMSIDIDVDSEGYYVSTTNPIGYCGEDTWNLTVNADEGSLLEGEDGREFELNIQLWEGIEGNVVVAEKGKEYDLMTSADTQDYLLIPNITNQQYAVRYLDEVEETVDVKVYYEDTFTSLEKSLTLENKEYGIEKGEYGLTWANERNMKIEGTYSDYCLVTCENGDKDLEYSLQYDDVPVLKNITVDNESAVWIKAGGYNWSDVYGWPLYATYSDGSKQHIWGSRYYCNTEGRHDNNIYIGHDDYGNCLFVEQTNDAAMFDQDNLLLAGTYPVEITVGEQVFEDELIVKSGNLISPNDPYTPTVPTAPVTPDDPTEPGDSEENIPTEYEKELVQYDEDWTIFQYLDLETDRPMFDIKYRGMTVEELAEEGLALQYRFYCKNFELQIFSSYRWYNINDTVPTDDITHFESYKDKYYIQFQIIDSNNMTVSRSYTPYLWPQNNEAPYILFSNIDYCEDYDLRKESNVLSVTLTYSEPLTSSYNLGVYEFAHFNAWDKSLSEEYSVENLSFRNYTNTFKVDDAIYTIERCSVSFDLKMSKFYYDTNSSVHTYVYYGTELLGIKGTYSNQKPSVFVLSTITPATIRDETNNYIQTENVTITSPSNTVAPGSQIANPSPVILPGTGTEISSPDTGTGKEEKVAVNKVKIFGKKTVKAGKKITLKATVMPRNATNKAIKWSTSNKKFATVSKKGVIKAKKAGKGKTVKITAIAKDNSMKKATIKIKIK